MEYIYESFLVQRLWMFVRGAHFLFNVYGCC